MPNSLSDKLKNVFSRKNVTIGGVGIGVLVIIFLVATAYYYVTTPAETIIVTTDPLPQGLSTNFTMDSLTDHVVAHLDYMIKTASSNVTNDLAREEGLGPRSVKQTFIPIRALSNTPSPLFTWQWKGYDLNFFRRIGTSLKVKRYVALDVVGLPDKSWRLRAWQKESPNYQPISSGSAPRSGVACTDFEKCADDLAEQILGSLDTRRLLNYYIKKNTRDANQQVVVIYKTIPVVALDVEDLVAWGNAYYGLGQFDEALQKFQDALNKEKYSCPARVGRGFVYFTRPHGTQLLADLQYAEQDFREGVSCNRNEFTLNSLCNTLLREWNNSPENSPNRDPRVLAEGKENCEKALAINPEFVIAAVNTAYILYRQEKHAEALSQLESLSQRYPTNSNLFLNYGFLSYLEYLSDKTQDRLKQAIAETHKCWELDPNSRAALNNLGYFYYEDGNYAKAVEFWRKAIEASPDDPDCVAGLALGLYQTGDPTSATKLLTRAIQIDSGFRDSKYVKEKHYWSDRASSDLVRLVNLLPADKQSTNAEKSNAGLVSSRRAF